MKAQRILAVVGLVLMAISLVCFLGAVVILLTLSAKRKQPDEGKTE